ncbi:hypothetical protein N9D23_00435 [Rubripirellula sp.]|nr:hypothetical protein [Rubripirellula sp.]
MPDRNAQFGSQAIYVALDSKQFVGFISITKSGYIDLAYARASVQSAVVLPRPSGAILKIASNTDVAWIGVFTSLLTHWLLVAVGCGITQEEAVGICDPMSRRSEMEQRII